MVCPTSTFRFNNPIGEESRDIAPEASKILERDKYVDDLIHSCSSTQNVYLRIVELEKILNASSFKIKEWQCSSAQFKAQMNTRKNSTIRSPPDQVTSVTVSKEDAAPKDVPIKYDEELPTASKVSLDREGSAQNIRRFLESWFRVPESS